MKSLYKHSLTIKTFLLIVSAAIAVIISVIQQIYSLDTPYSAITVLNNKEYSFELPKVYDEESVIILVMPDSSVKGNLYYKVHQSREEWHTIPLTRTGDKLVGSIPDFKPNVKVDYFLEFQSGKEVASIAKNNPLVVRFQAKTPKYLVFPFYVSLFFAIIFISFSGGLASFGFDNYKRYTQIAFWVLLIGGICFGLLLHILAFRHLFLKISNYNDLFYYRILIIFFMWWALYKIQKKKPARILTILISLFIILFYCLPQEVLLYWITD